MDRFDQLPALIGYLPSLEGISKLSVNYARHTRLINTGDICYTFPGTLLAAGRNYGPWNFSASAEVVNDHFSKVLFFLPCRIAPPPFDEDGFPFVEASRFIEGLKIPFITVSESIQTADYEYDPGFHRRLRPEVVRYLHTLADHTEVVGTRGAYSAEVMQKLGIKNVEAVGCPSLYINGPSLPSQLLTPKPFRAVREVAVCYSNYQMQAHSRIRDVLAHAVKNRFHYVEQSFNLLVKALHYPGYIEGADLVKAHKVFHGFREIQDLFREGLVHYFTNYTLWKDFLGTMDFAFGARMHGLTPALQCGIPSLFIAHDARVREMCEFFDLPFVAERDLPAELDTEALYNRADFASAVANYPARYQAFLGFLTKNGVHPNCDPHGWILNYWEPEPAPEVAKGETCVRKAFNGHLFDLLCGLGEETVRANSSEVEARIREIAQLWYRMRVTLGEHF